MSDKQQDDYYTSYNYYERKPVYIKEEDLRQDQFDRLVKSDVFCMIPWIHIHAFPNGQTYPCCLGDDKYPIGNLHENTIKEVWNGDPYKLMRKNMLEEKPCKECSKCYEQEKHGFMSMRNSSNKSFGHNISIVDQTKPDGTFEDFKLRYYDIRFTNLCNFSCRTCGGWFSSSWYQEEVDLFGARSYPQFMYAGKDKDDMWNQMQEHIPYLEQIYFAGGEPLIMEEHYNLLKELVRREMFDVRLQYNTNFSRLNLKTENVLDYWKLFSNVSVGASLDAMGPRAEYIRKGTDWDTIIRNREQMIEVCPSVDFFVSSTVSMLNVLHVMDFHRSWAEQGLIKASDWNINILQGPDRLRIDVLPEKYKQQVKEKILEHIEWLRPQDTLQRAIVGYESILKFMFDDDKSWLLSEFFTVNDKSDNYRNENFENVFPEYAELRSYCISKSKFEDLEKAKSVYNLNPSLDGPYGEYLKQFKDSKGAQYSTEIHNLIKKWFRK
jgi:radical SAM protein with 4Fe4S-binding SPASM domain